MSEYYVFDKSVPKDDDKTWNAQKETESKRQGQALTAYFNALAKSVGVVDSVKVGSPMIGFAPPVLQIFTAAATAGKLEAASKGRLHISKIELH